MSDFSPQFVKLREELGFVHTVRLGEHRRVFFFSHRLDRIPFESVAAESSTISHRPAGSDLIADTFRADLLRVR